MPTYQYVTALACSERLYQRELLESACTILGHIRGVNAYLRMIKDGWQAASKIPSKVRTVTRPTKLLHAACKARTAPQRMILAERYLAIGTRWIIQFVGYSTMSTAM